MMPIRLLFFLIAVACAAMMGFALYLQHVEYLEPCPLCIFQRVAVIAVGVVSLLAALHNSQSWGRRVYAWLVTAFAATGAGIAAWHVHLQSLPPDQVPECGPGLDFMLERFAFSEVLQRVFRGSGECAEVQWEFLSLSIPSWSVIGFLMLVLLGLYLALRKL